MNLESGPEITIVKIEGAFGQETENYHSHNDLHESENAADSMEFTELKPGILPELFPETGCSNSTFQPLLIPPIQYHDENLNTLQPTLEPEATETEPGIQIKTEIDIDYPGDTSADLLENSDPLADEVDHRLNEKRGPVSKKETFACGHCKRRFPSKNAVALHISLSHINGTSKTSRKARTNTSTVTSIRTSFSKIANNLPIHEVKKTTHQTTRPQFKCNVCSKRFATKFGKKRHILQKHKTNNVVNEGASKNNSSTAATHSPRKLLPCKFCTKTFSTVSGLEAHVVNQHKEFQCSVCLNIFIDEESLKSHLTSHKTKNNSNKIRNRSNYFCDVCSRGFRYKIQIRNHYQIMHQDLFYCFNCFKTFGEEKDFNQHIVGCNQHVHRAEIRQSAPGTGPGIEEENGHGLSLEILPKKANPRVCDDCEKKFSKLFFNLKRFKKGSSSKNSYNCGKCPLLFGTSRALESHVEHHTMKCHLCEFSYTMKIDLWEHLEIQHASERFTEHCKMCNKVFTSYKIQEEEPGSDDCSVLNSSGENDSDTFSECSIESEEEEENILFCNLEVCSFETKDRKKMALHSQKAHQLPKVHLPRLVFKIQSFGVKIKAFL